MNENKCYPFSWLKNAIFYEVPSFELFLKANFNPFVNLIKISLDSVALCDQAVNKNNDILTLLLYLLQDLEH